MSETIRNTLSILDSANNVAYLPRRIPDARDDDIRKLITQNISDGTIAELFSEVNDDRASVLRAFAERMASSAVRNNSPDDLVLGLVAISIAVNAGDLRDCLIQLPLFSDALRRLKANRLATCRRVEDVVGHDRAALVLGLITDTAKPIESMGYEAGSDVDGFRYSRGW